MPTKEQLHAIAKHIENTFPDYHFLILMTPKEHAKILAVVSNLPRDAQPLLADIFVQGFKGLETGESMAINLNKTH